MWHNIITINKLIMLLPDEYFKSTTIIPQGLWCCHVSLLSLVIIHPIYIWMLLNSSILYNPHNNFPFNFISLGKTDSSITINRFRLYQKSLHAHCHSLMHAQSYPSSALTLSEILHKVKPNLICWYFSKLTLNMIG